MKRLLVATLLLAIWACRPAVGQARPEAMSAVEVEALRESAYVPIDRVRTYEKILDARAHRIDEIVSRRRHPGSVQDLHDAMDQFADILDELNDNLDEFEKKHRDIRKTLPHLTVSAERWKLTLQSPPDDDEYNAVRRIALHNAADTHALAQETLTSLDAYFREHPEAAAAEKKRNESAHSPTVDGPR